MLWKAVQWPGALVMLLCVGCAASPPEVTQGPRTRVCGHVLSQTVAPVGLTTWFSDLPHAGLKNRFIMPLSRIAGTWFRVSDDCSRGAAVTVTPSGIVEICHQVLAADGRYEAIRVTPLTAGQAMITATRDGQDSVSTQITVQDRPPHTTSSVSPSSRPTPGGTNCSS